MKSIKNHLMFILPLVAILLGVQFFLIFERLANAYEEKLKNSYTILAVSENELTTKDFKAMNSNIASSTKVEKKEILKEISVGQTPEDVEEILKSLPNFYNIKLAKYLDTEDINKLKKQLIASGKVKKVETFEGSYTSNYKLFKFIKFILNLFILFMGIVSLFLVIKQMEVWGYIHRERMQVMEIFGAPLMLRSGILFRVAFLDAIVSTLIIVSVFLFFSYYGIDVGGIDIVEQNNKLLFLPFDGAILFSSALLMVIISVYSVVTSSKEKDI
ncbi:Cell division protein FtsX [Sulfurovum sp. enrichment culture clone C5]|uniref:Cell division protein FtsX n=1 Tax=Sulfurovum sp. enrichment culture clone C5 TaxID=497650 RepID=A0A0S4XP03_9BACT|nr:Cell division protein FtsX [Sulfurovum sp. enrichment culture clone C5]